MQWLARGEHELPADDTWLAPAEAARLAGYRFTKRRTEYRLRRWTGKHAVAAAAGLVTTPAGLAAIEVLNRPGGAPYVRVDGEPLPVDVSLTDRAGWAVCLVGSGDRQGGEGQGGDRQAVGVDLELVEPRSRGFVEDFLTTAERDHVLGLAPGPERDAVANLYWSAKESALKVLRVGLRADTRSVQVQLGELSRPDGWAPLEVVQRIAVGASPAGRRFPGWWRRDGVFVLTVTYAPAGDREADPPRPAAPPRLLAAASADLGTAVPVHRWLERPVSR